MKPELGQIVSQIFSFLILLWFLKRYAWVPLIKFMDERKQKIIDELNEVDEQRKEADGLMNLYTHKLADLESLAQAKFAEAVEKGREKAEKILEEAREEAKEITLKAKEDLSGEVEKAKSDMKKEIIEMAMGATEKILSIRLNKENQEALMAEFIDNIEAN